MTVGIGEVIRLTNFTTHNPPPDPLMSVSYKAPKKQVFVAVLLGVEPKDGSAPLDIDEIMDKMGWVRKSDT